MESLTDGNLYGTHNDAHNEQKPSPSNLVRMDDLICQRAREEDGVRLVAYPASERGLTDYELFTAKSLDIYIANAAERLIGDGIDMMSVEDYGDDDSPVVGLLGHSNFDYLITMLALSRLGYAVLILSPRLAIAAYESLLDETECSILVCSGQLNAVVDEIKRRRPLNSVPIVSRFELERNLSLPFMSPTQSVDVSLGQKTAYIMHSSGSTGLPRCIYLSHASCLSNFANGHALKALLTVPLYHMHGHASLFRAIYQRKTCYMYNASLPLTSSNLTAVIEAVRPEIVLSVPYGLKLIAENQRGINALKSCKMVSYAGSGCPDELGDYLTKQGITLVSVFGATETGLVMSSNRSADDTAWNYLRVIPSAKPYVWMKLIENESYELVVLDGLGSKIASNSDEPPNSYYTRDIFVPHPSIPDAWKYHGRFDDRITLVNGEKILPLPIEGRIRQEALVREAVVFGISRSIPGLLVFRNDRGADLTDEDFVERIWPAVEDANGKTESFSQISRETIIPMPATTEYPRTDKGTIIRAQVYQVFDKEISKMYEDQENTTEGTLKFDINGIEACLLRMFRNHLGMQIASAQADFFAAGFDSLQATRLLHVIKKELYLNGKGDEVSTSTLYGTQTVQGMAKFLHAIQTGTPQADQEATAISEMAAMIEKYSSFSPHISSLIHFNAHEAVVLTGATGSLGAWVLSKLVSFPSPPRIYCLVRAESHQHALDRILRSLQKSQIDLSPDRMKDIVALPSDLSSPSLGLASDMLEQLKGSTTHIVHIAWPVNFMLPLSAFEKQIAGTHNLIELSLSVRRTKPAKFIFCSSISAVTESPSLVQEDYIPDLSSAQSMGYARSKLVAERIMQHATERAGARATIARIGQIVGDTVNGVWNDSEAIPLMIRSALVTDALPALEGESCAWLPVDTVAAAVLDIAGLDGAGHSRDAQVVDQEDEGGGVYNLVNHRAFPWAEELLPALREAGFEFETVETREWLGRLTQSEPDADKNPAVKLLDFWTEKYGGSSAAAEAETKHPTCFDTERARKQSRALREVPDMIAEGYVNKFVQRWLERWNFGARGGEEGARSIGGGNGEQVEARLHQGS